MPPSARRLPALESPVLGNVLTRTTRRFYAASALVSFFFVRALVHETRGRELEQMIG